MKTILKMSQRSLQKVVVFLLVVSLILVEACNYKSDAEAYIRGTEGGVVVNVEILSGKGSVEHVLTERDCEEYGWGKDVSYNCEINATVTKLVPQATGDMAPVTFEKTYHVGLTVPCFPGTKIELDCEDPLIVQVPEDWSITNATFSKGGDFVDHLVVQWYDPPAELQANFYKPEPGHKLIVIGFPVGTPYDLYDINIEWDFAKTGPCLIKAVFAAEAIYTDPHTGDIHTFLPPASTTETDFALINDPIFTQEFMAARVHTKSITDQAASSYGLSNTNDMTYMIVDPDGSAADEIDLTDLRLVVR